MKPVSSRTWTAAVLTVALAACAGAPSEPEPEPGTDVDVATTPTALSSKLRYCLAPELGASKDIVATLIAAVADAPGDGTVTLEYVPEADASCRFDNPDIDLAVASWSPGGGCSTTAEDFACMVRTLLVDLEDLGTSTVDVADPEVATDLRMQLDYMLELAPEAPAVVGPPVPDPTIPSPAPCTAVIQSITPSAPTSYQATTLVGTYTVDPSCLLNVVSWTSDIDGLFGWWPTVTQQFSVGTHNISFDVSVQCPDPNDPSQWVTTGCSATTTLDVTQGVLVAGDYCSHSADWWMAEEQAGTVHIQDESQTATMALSGTGGQDLLIGNDRPNRINGRGTGDCLIGNNERDHIEGHGGADTIFGNDGEDRIVGNDDRDVIRGGRHNDRIRGGNGGDSLYGEDGDDKLDGNYDKDTLFGGSGNDRMLGGWDDDYLSGGDGNDCVRGDSGDDQLFGDLGNDNLKGELGRDQVSGGGDNDILDGGWHDDVLHGNAGDDAIHGDLGDDSLFGDDGDDGLCGGIGSDTKDGGAHVNGDGCHGGGPNCEAVWATCQLPLPPPC